MLACEMASDEQTVPVACGLTRETSAFSGSAKELLQLGQAKP